MDRNGEIVLYQNQDGQIKLEVNILDETVWLTQEQMALLFGKGRSTVTEHIANVYKEGELEKNPTCRKFRRVQQEGRREVEREIEYYNLDVIISVGYRVKSQQGTQFPCVPTNVRHLTHRKLPGAKVQKNSCPPRTQGIISVFCFLSF